MAYIGTIPAEAYTSFAVQHFTTSATDTFTLDFPVANENEIALFINNVRQEPGSSYAYTASGTTLTLASAITGSDSMYCVFIGKAVQTVTPAVGSVTNDMLAGSIANAKLANSSITLNGSAVSLGGSATVGGTNTPSFHAYRNSNYTVSDSTWTKIPIDTELFDSDNMYDSSTNYRFTPTTAGKYFIYASTKSGVALTAHYTAIRKNGSEVVVAHGNGSVGSVFNCQSIIDFNGSTDYVEVYAYYQGGSNSDQNFRSTFFGGFKIII